MTSDDYGRTAGRTRWFDFAPWQTNAALALIGVGLICATRQMVRENDGFWLGFDGVSSLSVFLYVGAIAVLLLKPRNTNRWTLPIIVGVAVLARCADLFYDPFLSSDVYRYAWDGVVQHAGINPYRYVPGNTALTFLREPNSDLFGSMNRRDYAHTIYPPAAQVMFYLITAISPTMTFMKVAMVACEGVTVYTLTLLLKRLGRPVAWVLLYAWCPTAIWEFGGSGHVDALVILWIVLALLFRMKRNVWLTGLFLGLAVLTKFYPLVLFPALYQRRADGKLDWKMPAVMAGLGVGLYSLYLSAGKLVFGFLGGYAQEEGLETGTRFFLLEFAQHLPGLHSVGNGAYMIFCGLVFAGLMVWAWRTCVRPESDGAQFLRVAMFFGLAMMLLFSPHYPWYVAWLIPFLVLMPSLTVLTYVCGLFYWCTTGWAVGSGPKQFHLNEMLYLWVLVAAVVEFGLYRVPAFRRWWIRTAPLTLAGEDGRA